ncbi:MAG: TIR domain-containing protein [Anaerolineae bacterium]|nr:TIR domain-containing protein [Anaerolineae bacterium]
MIYQRNIYISYAEEDRNIAEQLNDWLTSELGSDRTWLRDFHLDGGALIKPTIEDAIDAANWFILLVSENSVKSTWLTVEASASTFLSLKNRDFNIVVIRLDDSPFPVHLEIILENEYRKLSLNAHSKSYDEIFLSLAEYISHTMPDSKNSDVFIDRGKEIDEFMRAARRYKIIFVRGLLGIGKTAFVTNRVPNKGEGLGKQPITVKLSRGHSLDRFSREIIRESRFEQPLVPNITDAELLQRALDCLRQRSQRFFLFIDDVEQGYDVGNRLWDWLESFLLTFAESNINTHIVLATT